MSQKRTSLERFRLKRVLDALAYKEGRGTELVSLYVPPGRQISEVVQMLKEEWGTASNIKSNTTRKNVQDAIIKTIQRVKLFKRVPDSGLVVFCGAIPQNGLGSERMETYVVTPPEPINIYLYRCDSRFHIEHLMDLLKEKEAFGILLVDSSGATFATLKGRRLEIVQEITSGIPGKHRAGGQSARRFERAREAQVVEFFKRVGEHANDVFLSVPELKGLILGGPGPTKFDFEKGRFLDYRLKEKIIATMDTAYTGEQGVEETVERAPEIIRNIRYVEEKRVVQKFLYEIGHDTGLATYGEREIRRALKSGLVDTLFLSESLDKTRAEVECTSCGYTYQKTMGSSEIPDFELSLSNKSCQKCGVSTLSIAEEKDIIEELADLAEQSGSEVEIVSTETEEGQMLWKSFGGIAATLRYKLTNH
ncbi:MAG: peptide chain release factor aRF-1 [Candidatus Bathyarchaeota archaeon]|nr:peptide chain release factor aRF-1 [Candidatus Bathyarchaeota archaeon]